MLAAQIEGSTSFIRKLCIAECIGNGMIPVALIGLSDSLKRLGTRPRGHTTLFGDFICRYAWNRHAKRLQDQEQIEQQHQGSCSNAAR